MIQLKVLNACNNIRIGLCFSCVLHQDNLLFKWFYYYLQQSWPPKDHRTKPILEIHPSKPQLSYRPVKHQIDYDSELFMAILYQRKYSSKKSSLSQNITYYYIADISFYMILKNSQTKSHDHNPKRSRDEVHTCTSIFT